MATGILVVNKPEEWTSHDVVAKLRGVFREKRIGHAGTLDPMATGVLPVFLGRATRVVEFATEGDKEYIAGIRLGESRDTQDITGTLLSKQELSISRTELEAIFPQFTGKIQQIPPMYSAIKIQGKKLYELARKGQEVERPPRTITVSSIQLLDETNPYGDPLLKISCSKGTYIRTICHDMGQILQCGAAMSSLQRTMAAGFSINDALSLDEIISHSNPTELLQPIQSYFSQTEIQISKKQETKLRNGNDFPLLPEQEFAKGEYKVFSESGEFLALCSINGNIVHTIKSFFEVKSS